jgi:hypothetical protein
VLTGCTLLALSNLLNTIVQNRSRVTFELHWLGP